MSVQWNVYESFQALLQAGPYHFAIEGILLICILWLIAAKKPSSSKIKLSKKEEEQLLAEWTPEPLIVNPIDPSHPALHPRIIDGKIGLKVKIGEEELLNLGSHNYLNLSERSELEEAALTCLNTYGVGSCGPRGFYGTTEVHLIFEDRIAEFYGTEAAILYSYGFSTIASVIPAYSKKGDVIFVDEMANYAIQRGCDASRSRIIYFRHNDPLHLEELLEEQAKLDKKNPKKAAATRRFLLVEGIYMNTGLICPLPEIVRLRAKYKLRLFLDETCSFGTMGSNARGVLDHFNIPLKEVDIIMATLETAAAGSGGFATGTKFVIEHQRLSGLGYCFSASLPPMLAASSIKFLTVHKNKISARALRSIRGSYIGRDTLGRDICTILEDVVSCEVFIQLNFKHVDVIDILEKEGGELVVQLQDRCVQIHKALSNISDRMILVGDPISPIKHLQLKERLDNRSHEESYLRKIVDKAQEGGIAIVVASHLYQPSHPPLPPPSIRLAVNKDLSTKNIHLVKQVLTRAVTEALKYLFDEPSEENFQTDEI